MILRILGSAAGGGVPQWNCACENCTAARAGRLPHRTESCAAVSADGERWLLLNCSTDIGRQIESYPPLRPQERRGTPIDGMLLTDANVDHIGGLATLRQAGNHRFIIRSSATVRAIATAQPAFEPFAREPHRWLAVEPGTGCTPADERDLVGRSLHVRPLEVPGTTPGYAGRRRTPGAVLAYEISDGSAMVLFAPIFAEFDGALREAAGRADAALLDGSFYSDDELGASRLMAKTAHQLGHQPVGGDGGTLSKLNGASRTRILFTHLNNSNPMLDPDSPAFARVREAGCELAFDGQEIRL